ncbi:UNVERIFIED_CONTAM: Ankyrin repeat domain-containing protein 35, partial [Eudyptes pachyrhynchus]
RSLGSLRARAGELSRACRDKEGKMKKLLAETEKLSAEVLGLRGQSARLQLQLEVGASTRRHPLPPRPPLCHPPATSSPLFVTPCHLVPLFVTPCHLVPPLCHPLPPRPPSLSPPPPPSSPPQVQQKNHRDIVAVYRTHLLNAAQGFMDEGVHAMLLRILRTE